MAIRNLEDCSRSRVGGWDYCCNDAAGRRDLDYRFSFANYADSAQSLEVIVNLNRGEEVLDVLIRRVPVPRLFVRESRRAATTPLLPLWQ